jgi:hypothetical protein
VIREVKRQDVLQWHSWFAWYPVTVYLPKAMPDSPWNRELWCWLSTIERKGVNIPGNEIVWTYRVKQIPQNIADKISLLKQSGWEPCACPYCDGDEATATWLSPEGFEYTLHDAYVTVTRFDVKEIDS